MRISVARRNAQLDSLTASLNNGYLRIYDGARPANVDTVLGANVLLAELRYNVTAFGAAAGGVATANAFTQDGAANATGTASFTRSFASDGTTAIIDGSVGTSGAELNLSTLSIVQNVIVNCNGMTITQPDGA